MQGGYTFNGTTKVAASYGESNQDSSALDPVTGVAFNRVTHKMWTIGVYHDVTSWLKLVAEYNNYKQRSKTPVTDLPINGFDADAFSVGAFMTW